MENVNQRLNMAVIFICLAFYTVRTSASVSFKRQFLKVSQPQENCEVTLGTGYLGISEGPGLLKGKASSFVSWLLTVSRV